MNNNPTAFTFETSTEAAPQQSSNRQRPIVEFAVENKMVLKRRADREKDTKDTGRKRKRNETDTWTEKTEKDPKRFKGTRNSKSRDTKKVDRDTDGKATSGKVSGAADKRIKRKAKGTQDSQKKTIKRKPDLHMDDAPKKSQKRASSEKNPVGKKQKKKQETPKMPVISGDMKKWFS